MTTLLGRAAQASKAAVRLRREFTEGPTEADAARFLGRLTVREERMERDRVVEALRSRRSAAGETPTSFQGSCLVVASTTEAARRDVPLSGDRPTFGKVADATNASMDLLGRVSAASVDVVRIDDDVYRRIPKREVRVALLVAARRAARYAVVVRAPVVDDGTHLGRAVLDGPRHLLGHFGRAMAEPGDRFTDQGFVHHFFDEEPLFSEFTEAGLELVERQGYTFVLASARASLDPTMVLGETTSNEPPDGTLREIARVLRVLALTEHRRLRAPPERLVAEMRARGASCGRRAPIGRARLRRAIGWVDALVPTGANCLRRVLLELSLDAGAAGEPVIFGLDVGKTGHVAFAGREERSFDVAFEVPPRT